MTGKGKEGGRREADDGSESCEDAKSSPLHTLRTSLANGEWNTQKSTCGRLSEKNGSRSEGGGSWEDDTEAENEEARR